MKTSSSTVVGVDFGTSTCFVFKSSPNAPTDAVSIGKNHQAWMPSIAGFRDDELLVGEAADGLGWHVVRSIKSYITKNKDTVNVPAHNPEYTLSADGLIEAMLHEVATRASDGGDGVDLGTQGTVRMGCPAIWTGQQRKRLLTAAKQAGIAVGDSTLVDEPIAAGVAWIVERTMRLGERVDGRLLVFDMGGGTLDLAVLRVNGGGGAVPEIQVQSATGLDEAGDTLDMRIAKDFRDSLIADGTDVDSLPQQESLVGALLRAAREAKVELSGSLDVAVPLLYDGAKLPALKYSRERLNDAFAGQLDKAEQLVWASVRAARTTNLLGFKPSEVRAVPPVDLAADIKYVLLAGGMSQVPAVRERLYRMFPQADVFDNAGVGPQEMVAAGLSETMGYERLNLHRPGFDFILEWQGPSGEACAETIYPAYTPFYDYRRAVSEDTIDYRWRSTNQLPSRGFGRLRVVSIHEGAIDITVDNECIHALRVDFGHRDVTLSLSTNGTISIFDGQGRHQLIRVEKWPVLRSRDHATLLASNVGDTAHAVPAPDFASSSQMDIYPRQVARRGSY
jgi:Hsp70 protein